METKHTPGPWRQDSLGGTSIWAEPRGGACIADCEADSFSGRTQSRPLDERVANARLIAAAPELLAVAQYVVDRAEWQRWDEKDALLVMVRAAIAKATGA